ncbi:SDR family NAD(P)-dependent oxidoreductase [Candidatus Woesearchaeota archaeon]|nr:SDR family NAD(P)-dependent oxidoreductase [Candidatus Woesearchaeota archaeon]
MTKILITGGCGFIGSNLVEFLLEKTDWKINVLDNLSIGKKEDLKNIKGAAERVVFFKGDIRKKEDILKAIDSCDYVVNLAAQVGVIPSIEDPLLDAEINITGTLNVLNACVEKKVKKIVHASSAAILGDQDMPLDENSMPKPLSPYAASKLAGEQYCSAFAASYGLKSVALRFFNAYGPKSYGRGSVIPLFIQQMLDGKAVTIYGDGSQTRDFVYAKDICNAIYLSLITDLPNKFELFQVATSKETSVNELFTLLKEELQKQGITVLDAKYAPARSGEILRSYSDIAKSKSLLNYSPEIDLKEGISKAVTWFLSKKK